jgi:hypothetical protein
MTFYHEREYWFLCSIFSHQKAVSISSRSPKDIVDGLRNFGS